MVKVHKTFTIMNVWQRQPQEKSGSYLFTGAFLVTRGVAEMLSYEEIMCIHMETVLEAHCTGGLDYLQVFINQHGRKLFFIDQLDRETLEKSEFDPEHNHCTLMLAEEY
jgi:hypothetical protein